MCLWDHRTIPHCGDHPTLPEPGISCCGQLGCQSLIIIQPSSLGGLPRGSSGKETNWNAGDPSSIPGSGRSPGEGRGSPLQYSGLENSMDYSPWGHKDLDTTEQLSLYFLKSFVDPINISSDYVLTYTWIVNIDWKIKCKSLSQLLHSWINYNLQNYKLT